MKKIVAGLIAGAACLVLVSSALAGSTIGTDVHLDANSPTQDHPSKYFAAGHIVTSRQCRAGRQVKIFFSYGGSPARRLVDKAKTGSNGGFSGIGPSLSHEQEVSAIKFAVLAKKIGPKHHRKTCTGAIDVQG